MKNLQIGDNDFYGKRFNGHDLHNYLNDNGIDSSHIVWEKHSNDTKTYSMKERIPDWEDIYILMNEQNRRYSSHSLFHPYWYDLLFNKLFLEADVVHYHLLHNMNFDISLMPILTSLKPSVWTLHDPWALTGHCIHPFDCQGWKHGCGSCPDLKTEFTIANDATALNYHFKQFLYDKTDTDIVVASKWMLDLVNNSPIMHKFEKHLIPFGINLDVFHPQDQLSAKKKLGIPEGNLVISFRSQDWKLKGLEYIKAVLNRLEVDFPITLLTFSHRGLLPEFLNKYHLVELGWVFDETEIVNGYNAADIFIMPSTAESFGMMAMETMACGKPIIVFDETALAETVCAPYGGISVPKKNVEMLYSATYELLTNREKRISLGENALKIAKEKYDVKLYIRRMIELYAHVIDKKKKDHSKIFIIEQLMHFANDKNYINNDKPKLESKYSLLIENSRKEEFEKRIIELQNQNIELENSNGELLNQKAELENWNRELQQKIIDCQAMNNGLIAERDVLYNSSIAKFDRTLKKYRLLRFVIRTVFRMIRFPLKICRKIKKCGL
jgi:glycosyltransferase involved in cell wall biosynthesis